MNSHENGVRLKDHLLKQGVQVHPGVATVELNDFESAHEVTLPGDMKDTYSAFNGSLFPASPGMLVFWKLADVISVQESIKRTPRNAAVIQNAYREINTTYLQGFFVFADAMWEAQLYAIRLLPARNYEGGNEVIVLDGSTAVKVASTFTEFIERFIQQPVSLMLGD